MIYITGDTHRQFDYRFHLLDQNENNMVIILGDAGINYYLDIRDKRLKQELAKYKFKIFSIQGNHEERPENIKSYEEVDMFGGKVFIEESFPNLIFAKNGEIYNINGKKTLVIGGAYSVDKNHRLWFHLPYFKDEQLSKSEQKIILNRCKNLNVDVVLSHTCPYKYIPTEAFLPYVDQRKVDNSMEHFLDEIENSIDYDKWYCGHYHIGKVVDKLEFLYAGIKDFETDEFISDAYRTKILKR